jgi:DNA-binding NarL/FixJ family response regulator
MRIALVSDDVFAMRGLRDAVRDAIGRVKIQEIDNPALAADRIAIGRIDVAVLHVGQAPAVLVAAVGREAPWVRVVVVMPLARTTEIEQCLSAGAHGCLLSDPPATPVERLRATLDGGGALDARLAAVLARDFQAVLQGRRPGVGLTRREVQTLALMAEGCSNRVIAARLEVGEATVKSHVSRVMRKLESGSRTQAVARARDAGLL